MAQPRLPPPSASLEESRLAGHIGHLTAQEEAAIQSFKTICAEQGFYQPATDKSPASHDDGTLVRYLRARKFVPEDAFTQFKDTEIWRKENKLDALYEQIDINDYQEARSVYPQWIGRRDKRGIPIYLYEIGKLNSKKMIAYASANSKSTVAGPSPSKMLRLFALYENLTRFVMPLCSAVPGRPNPETPVDQSNNIVDISRVGLKQFWNLRSHMQDASTLATAHYPETLDRIFIIGAPSFFPTVWGWIKKWFDPITTSKIFILNHQDVLPTLTAFIDIENIPKKYGGGLDFECGMTPVLDAAVLDVLTLTAPDSAEAQKMFLTAPVKWIDGTEGDLVALGVGSVNGVVRKEKIAIMHADAARNAFSPPGTPGILYRGDYFSDPNPVVYNLAGRKPTAQNLAQNSVALGSIAQQPINENSGQMQVPPAPIVQQPIAQYPAQKPALQNPPAQDPIAQPSLTQNSMQNPIAPDPITQNPAQNSAIQNSIAQNSTPQNPLTQHPVEEKPVQPHTLVNGVENLQLTPTAEASGNVPPPISRGTSDFVTPAAYPAELQKRFP